MLTNVKCQVSVMKGCGNEMKFCSKREAERENKIFMYFTKLSSFLEKTLVHTTKQNKAILCCCCCIKCPFSLCFYTLYIISMDKHRALQMDRQTNKHNELFVILFYNGQKDKQRALCYYNGQTDKHREQ